MSDNFGFHYGIELLLEAKNGYETEIKFIQAGYESEIIEQKCATSLTFVSILIYWRGYFSDIFETRHYLSTIINCAIAFKIQGRFE